METVTIVFSSNDRFAMLLGVVLCSIFENKEGNYAIQVFVIDGGISAKNKVRLEILEKRYGFTITYAVPPRRLFENIRPADSPIELPIETYYRIALGSILPANCHKAIYMDVDAVVRGDVQELFFISLKGKTVGAVPDCFPEIRREHLKKLCAGIPSVIVPPAPAYFNAGVLLIDLDRWRARGVEEELLEFIRKSRGTLIYHDQDALNVVLLGDWKELPVKYNFFAELADLHSTIDPFIVHYAGGGKPWYVLSALPYRGDYIYYVNKTPWKNAKYRKLMDVPFSKKYGIYPLAWGAWSAYKKIKKILR